MKVEFTGEEWCVMYDSLGCIRRTLKAQGVDTPNIDSAREKMLSWVTKPQHSGAFTAVIEYEDQ